ncbi:MAG: hypothetical protein ABF289_09035, partial [Clostridiales bacterium]
SCNKFLIKHKYLNDDIENIKRNLSLYNKEEREYYTKILTVKESILKELIDIKKVLINSELKLSYILCCLQNIEAIFEKSKLSNILESYETEELNNYIESFKESLSKTLKSTHYDF